MIFQRRKPVRIFGESDKACTVEVRLNGKPLQSYPVKKGAFSFELPPQEAMENAVLEIGEVVLENVDFGEVWLAGGQSNMQFLVYWDAEREKVYACPPDEHFRYYDVARWSFEGEEKDGLRANDAKHWDKWFTFSPETSPYFSSLPTFFALNLRKALGVPVGIVGCNNGGTSASCWVPEEDLTGDLKVYLDEYAAATKNLNLKRYEILNYFIRADLCEETYHLGLRGGLTPEEAARLRLEHKSPQWLALMDRVREEFTPEEFAQIGPRTRNRPCSMWHTMVTKIAGFTFRGTMWYQGCDDKKKANLYPELMSKLIARWRSTFNDMPFIVTQLAPFRGGQDQGLGFPEVRAAQEQICKAERDVYLVSSSDVGNELDIHPKFKRKLGERTFLQALDKVYGIPTLSDAPTLDHAERTECGVRLVMKHAEGLHAEGEISALEILKDGVPVPFEASVEGETVAVRAPLKGAKEIEIKFAQALYYKVNLMNAAGIPAIPFRATI